MSCSLDSGRDRSLMFCTCSGDSSRKDFSSLGDISLQLIDVLIADLIILAAENADFLSSVESAFSSETTFTV